jgi:hypothetical protein
MRSGPMLTIVTERQDPRKNGQPGAVGAGASGGMGQAEEGGFGFFPCLAALRWFAATSDSRSR